MNKQTIIDIDEAIRKMEEFHRYAPSDARIDFNNLKKDVLQKAKNNSPSKKMFKKVQEISNQLNDLENKFRTFEQDIRNEESFNEQDMKILESINTQIELIRKHQNDNRQTTSQEAYEGAVAINKLVEHLNNDFNNINKGIRYLRSRTYMASKDLSKVQQLIEEIKVFEDRGVISGFIKEENLILQAFNNWIGWTKEVEQDVLRFATTKDALRMTSKKGLKENITRNPEINEEINATMSLLTNMYKHLQNADSNLRAIQSEIKKMKGFIPQLLAKFN